MTSQNTEPLHDFVPAANQGQDPALYELENEAIDPSCVLWRQLRQAADWQDKVLVDLGCGSGFWLPKYADAAEVIGVEPDQRLLGPARARDPEIQVLHGSAFSGAATSNRFCIWSSRRRSPSSGWPGTLSHWG